MPGRVPRTTPRVTVGMPVRNGEVFISGGIESLLGQSFGDLELVISDNASTDGTQAICEEYARRDPRVRYQRLDRNQGLQANFGRLIDEARGPYFMWAGHDDWWDPAYVERMVAVLDTQPSVVLAGSNAASIDQFDVRHAVFDNVAVYGHRGSTVDRVRRFLAEPPGNGHATMVYGLMRTPVIQRLGFAPPGAIANAERGYYAMDLLLLLRLVLEGEFQVDPDVLYCRRDTLWSAEDWARYRSRWRAHRHIAASARAARAVHGYYADVRRIIRASDLDAVNGQRALMRSTYRQELRAHPRTLGRLLGRTRRRLVQHLGRSRA